MLLFLLIIVNEDEWAHYQVKQLCHFYFAFLSQSSSTLKGKEDTIPDEHLFSCIYTLGVFPEMPNGRPLERNVVYILIFTFLVYLHKSPIVGHWNVM